MNLNQEGQDTEEFDDLITQLQYEVCDLVGCEQK